MKGDNPLLVEAEEFQDFVMEALYRHGLIIQCYCSQTYQLKGESLSHFEIKHDKKFRDTGNLYVEVGEYSPTLNTFVPSGINRRDNTWFVIIGDYKGVYIFTKPSLYTLWGKFPTIQTETSKGFLLPFITAKKVGVYVEF